jgi:hypothetical protein
MAARFAVITGNWSGAIWAATSGGAAGSAAVPTSAEDVTINKNVVVTLDDMSAVCLSLTLSVGTAGADAGGKIKASTTAHSKITVQGSITSTGSTGGSGTYSSFVDLDQSASAFNLEIVINNVRATGAGNGLTLDGNFVIKGKPRKRHTLTTGALTANSTTSVGIVDATGWEVGDQLVFATTQAYNATPRTDAVTIATITPGTPPAATITWTDGAGTAGAVLYDHATACVVGNFSSNLTIKGNTPSDLTWIKMTASASEMSSDGYFDNVLLYGMGGENGFASVLFAQTTNTRLKSISHNAFYQHLNNGIAISAMPSSCVREFNVFSSTAQTGNRWAITGSSTQVASGGYDDDVAIFRGQHGIQQVVPGQNPRRALISGLVGGAASNTSALRSMVSPASATGCKIWACNNALAPLGNLMLDNCELGTSYSGAINNTVFFPGYCDVLAKDTTVQTSGTIIQSINLLPDDGQIVFQNKNDDAAVQEIYRNHSATVPVIQRDTTTKSRSTSSVAMTCNAATAIDQAFEVLAKAGETIRILCLVQKSGTPAYGASTLPKVTVSGLGITPVVATMSSGTAADAWETLTVDATNSGAADGNLTVTFTAQSATAGAKAYFSGVPVAPFVSRCRHYGDQFNETSPTRVVDTLASASEATAAAYTGMAITWGASSSSTAITTSQTFQKLYDYHQSQAVLNVGSALALTGAGVAGSPALFAAGDVTISDGAVLNGSGSLSMGGFTLLATEFSSGTNYTYTGGTWSQLSTVPSFNGGTLNLGAEDTFAFSATAATVTCAPSADAVTYEMGGCTFSGAMVFRNTHATRGITVKVPAGTDYTTTTAGGSITVQVASAALTIAANVSLAGAEVRIYDLDSTGNNLGTELAGTETCPTATYDYAGTGGNIVWIQVLKTGYEEFGQQVTVPSTASTFTATLRPDSNA